MWEFTTLLGESFDRIPDKLDTDPCNYDETLKDKYADLWQKDMKSKMLSMYSNQVWDLMEPPEGIKPIGCKWIYKKREEQTVRLKLLRLGLKQKGLLRKK